MLADALPPVVARTDCVLRTLTSARLRIYFQHPAVTLRLLETLADRLIPHVEAMPSSAKPAGLEGRPLSRHTRRNNQSRRFTCDAGMC